ncbi:hypothetical protein BGX23_004964 [Mortierella sp. AD031]|nr:hypothetical protein BGX23_004964 [Mortierella sp. AD031]
MKFSAALTIATLLVIVQSVTLASPVAATESNLEKRILEPCKDYTGVCVSPQACGGGIESKKRADGKYIDGPCDRPRPGFICCINF